MNPAKAPGTSSDCRRCSSIFFLILLDRLRGHADDDHHRTDGDPTFDTNPLGSGYYTWKQRKFSIGTFTFGFVTVGRDDHHRDVHPRPAAVVSPAGKRGPHNRLIYEVNRDLPDIFGITSN